jgi:transcriptional regulator with XRE-family HTH domain
MSFKFDVMKDLNRLKIVLCEKKKTSKWLAAELDKNPTTISKWCTNTIQPDLPTLNRIAELLDVDIKDLIQSTKQS